MKRLAALLLAALPWALPAQAAYPFNRAAVGGEHSNLDNGSPDWNAVTLQLSRHWSQRQLAELQLTETRRFGVRDTELALGGALPLSPTLTGSLRLAHSPTHRVLARGSAAGALQWEFRKAWLLHGGLKHTRYDATNVDHASLMLEHYFGDFSALAAVHSVRAFGRTNQAWELRGAWYYADASSIGLIAGSGDEAAQVAPGTVALARVRSLALTGRHAFGAGPWAVRYGLHRVRQGGFHTRSGASLGVERDF